MSIFLILTLMSQSMVKLGILTYYSINSNVIESLYCVNKDKPEMCCKGKCYISKQLDGSEKLPKDIVLNESEIPLFVLPSSIKLMPIQSPILDFTSEYPHYIHSGYALDVLHPPCTA